jgi:ferrous iron transport protein A
MQLRRRHRHRKVIEDSRVNTEGYVPLTCLREGARAVVTHTAGGLGVVRRLSEMGLTPGCEVKLLRKCSFRGPLEVEVRDVSLAVGYNLASDIFVQPLEGQAK